jgi:ribosome recycling factor
MVIDGANVEELKGRMQKVLLSLREDLSGIRAGRASTNLLDPITVELYGSRMPIKQMASMSIPEPRLILIQPWDKGAVSAIEKAIRDSDLGLNPIKDGQNLRVPLPELTEDRRRDLVKLTNKYGEQAKVTLRSLRRDVIDQGKKLEKSKEISQDDLRQLEKQVQELTDQHVRDVDQIVAQKEADILAV